MKYTVEIHDEMADEIFLVKLKEDYISLCEEIYCIKSAYGSDIIRYPDHVREDYEANYDYAIAMERLFRYYMTRDEAILLERKGTDIRYGKTA